MGMGCLGGAAVWRRTRERKVAGSTPGWGAIKSTRSTQPSIPPGSVNRVPACMAGVRRGAFTCVGWQVTLRDPIWPLPFYLLLFDCLLQQVFGILLYLVVCREVWV